MLSERSDDVPHLIKPLIGNRMSNTKKDLRMSGLMDMAPTLEMRDKDQVAALPLGSHIGMDPWSDHVRLLKVTPADRFSARDKMPFEITPFEIHLTREGSKPAAAAATTPAPTAAAAGDTQAAAPVAHP